MDNKGSSVTVLVIAFIFILAAMFVAVLTLSGTFEKAGFEFLSAFNMYIFGIIIAIILAVIGLLLLYFGLHGS
jgi:Fe2+ transport system protein B